MEEKDPHLFSQLQTRRTRSPDWTSKSSRFRMTNGINR
ncbi:DUF935 domain-containing protein [Paenibacillus melissococcoides]|nr:DUF935 domain-containing protein [Paenibacillus melissococcoides]